MSFDSLAQNTYPSSGNVGIGTTSPQTLLHVYSNVSNGGTNNAFFENPNAAGRSQILIASSLSNNYIRFMTHGTSFTGDNYLSDNTSEAGIALIAGQGTSLSKLSLGTVEAKPLSFFTSNAERLFIKSTGEVGIGTVNPQAALSLGAVNGKRMLIYDGGSGGVQAGAGVDMSGTARELSFFHSTSDGTNGNISFGKRLESSGAYTELMRVQGNGNVGIGTTTPQAKLAVNGDIFSKKIKVTQTGWPDYVFQASYELRPLSDLEQFIQQHHHLPEVPSALEIEKRGLDIGDNQATLLKKIEELTLYVIEQNKKQEAQNQKLQELDMRVNVLQQENDRLRKQSKK